MERCTRCYVHFSVSRACDNIRAYVSFRQVMLHTTYHCLQLLVDSNKLRVGRQADKRCAHVRQGYRDADKYLER